MRSLTLLVTIATLASAGLAEAKCLTNCGASKKESAESSLARKKSQLKRSKAMSARKVETHNNYSSINNKHSKRIEDVRKNSVKVTTSVANPGQAQYEAELREYEQKKRDYEKALAAYEARKLEMRAAQSKSAAAHKANKSKAMSAVTVTTTQAKPIAPMAPVAPAMTSTNVSTTAAAAPAATPAKSPIILSYDGSYEGASLQAPGGAFAPNTDGTESDTPQLITHMLNLGYKASPDLSFQFTPMLQTFHTGNGGTSWLDPYLRVKLNNIYKQGPVQFNSDLRAYPGLTDSSKAKGRLGRLRNTHYLNIDMAKGLSFNWVSYLRLSFYNDDGRVPLEKSLGDDFKVYVNPAINYSFTDNFSGAVQWEGETAHEYGEDPGFNTGSSGQFKLGVTWAPIAGVYLNPMIGLKTGKDSRLFDGRSTQVLMDFGFSAF